MNVIHIVHYVYWIINIFSKNRSILKITSKRVKFTSKSLKLTSKSPKFTSKSLKLTSKQAKFTSKRRFTSKSLKLTSKRRFTSITDSLDHVVALNIKSKKFL
ncbi:hypothetical protein [Peribacillus simplex]|uniref:Uncharacterized protein n=1 Tax=Peribacillus simplex NBRC 15720 = DSM 1321 TaxID=1349754 RepID=A0A223EJV8_9BACI|nr:hypothetical protein [Peribacillus simplex]ASS95375.1 hypothetical protein BS1321_16515 [Peribacillus simplex NBRC 15720 = DSM 1321]MEC1399963.1 hypothetical protein [Peribacillus simplex]